jgi:2-phospho-L-lactate guanylyltransferase
MQPARVPSIAIVLPVKPFHLAKRRLSPALCEASRANLARAMLEDVLDVATDQSFGATVFVVTADSHVAQIATARGASVVPERFASGMSHAVCRAVPDVRRAGLETLLVIPSDVPLITVDDVRAILHVRANERDVVLVPARRDGGTNGMAYGSSVDMPLRFGEDSFERHADAATGCGLEPRRLWLERISLDVDMPADVEALLAQGDATRAQRLLRTLALPRRAMQEAIS